MSTLPEVPLIIVGAAFLAVGLLLYRRRRRSNAATKVFVQDLPNLAPRRTGRTLEGRVVEVVEDLAVVRLDHEAMLTLPAAGLWVDRYIRVYEYEDGTWHVGEHPAWAATKEQAR